MSRHNNMSYLCIVLIKMGKNEYYIKIGHINVSDFGVVLI